jgi:hypothetical protein
MSQIPDPVSIVSEFPEDLYESMREYISSHPNWDQYRLLQAALAGFLFQHGCKDRAVTRHYLDGLFQRDAAAALQPLSRN